MQAKALQRPPGYAEDIKLHSFMWDEDSGVYQMTDENWMKMKKKWTPKQEMPIHPIRQNSNKCKFASCGCKGKPIKCNQLGNLGNLCPDTKDKECPFRSGSEAKPLPFFQKRKSICDKCELDKTYCEIAHEEGCAVNRMQNDPKHFCCNEAWGKEPDYIFYIIDGFKISETDWKLRNKANKPPKPTSDT